jgi:hypothetical protein
VVKEGHNDVAPDGELSPLDEAAVTMHELYTSLRRAGFSRSEAVTVIAKFAAEIITQQQAQQGDEDT